MRNLLFLTLLAVLVACNSATKKSSQVSESAQPTYGLQLLWESDTTLLTSESVLIDEERNTLYVSCVNQNPWEKDGNGFISKLDRNGKVTKLQWIVGLDGPKGMGISGNSLFIADINSLVEADINTGKIIDKISLNGKPDLNDITVAADGTVYVSGTSSDTIYKLVDGSLVPVFKGNTGERLNGLHWEKDRLLLLTSKSSTFYEISWNTMNAKVIAENMGSGDGIAPIGDGGYICTSWKGVIFHVSANNKVTELLNTSNLNENTADIDFCQKNQILYVPTFFKNTVKAYKLIKN